MREWSDNWDRHGFMKGVWDKADADWRQLCQEKCEHGVSVHRFRCCVC